MRNKVIGAVAVCIVAALSFYGGTYYVINSGKYVLSSYVTPQTLDGIVAARSYGAMTVQPSSGKAVQIVLNGNTTVFLSPSVPKKIPDIIVGQRVTVFFVYGIALNVIIWPPSATSASTTPAQP